jgi:DNA-binding GntR family transcriptional regulator
MSPTDDTPATPRFHARDVPTLATSVQREIERMILAGEVAAGARLSESALAQAMGVSRGPVREAMRGLAQLGLVDVVANKGVVVRAVSAEEALDLYELRAGIFGVACEAVAARAESAAVAELRAVQAELAAAVEAGDRDGYYAANIRFHRRILELSGNRPAREAYERVVASMHLFRRRGLARVMNMQASLAEHQTIIDAVAAGDAEAAGAAGRRHVRSGRDRFRRSLAENEDATNNDEIEPAMWA